MTKVSPQLKGLLDKEQFFWKATIDMEKGYCHTFNLNQLEEFQYIPATCNDCLYNPSIEFDTIGINKKISKFFSMTIHDGKQFPDARVLNGWTAIPYGGMVYTFRLYT